MRWNDGGHAVGTPDATHGDKIRLLGEVSTGGVPALLRVLRRAYGGEDEAARTIPLSSLLRAVPGMGSVTVHELISTEGIRENQCLADIEPGRVAGLLRMLEPLT